MKMRGFAAGCKIVAIVLMAAVLGIAVYTGLTAEELGLSDHSKGAVYDVKYYQPKTKKAMLLIPGLMASTVYDVETSAPLWGFGGFGRIALELLTITNSGDAAASEAYVQGFINTITCDEDNVPKTKVRVGNMQDRDAYASFNGMKYLYDILEPLYGQQYDVIVWQYDWRQSNTGSALQLEKFINYHGFTEVMFFTHSMGGVVVSNYLARSQANRDMTKLFMPFGAPLLGSMDAVNNLFDTQEQAGIMANAFSALKNLYNVDINLQTIARNLASVYELLPFPEFASSPYFSASAGDYAGIGSPIIYNGSEQDMKKLLEFMASFGWTHKADGQLSPVMGHLPEYMDNLYIEIDGVRQFITNAVPTEYIVGVDVKTAVGASIDKDGKIIGKTFSNLGDGTVPAYSASAGTPLTADNVHLVYGIGHGPLANGKDFEGNDPEKTGLQYVASIMAKYIEKTDAQR